MPHLPRALLTLLLAAPVTAAGAGPLEITAAWVRATPPGARTAAAYLTIANHGPADRLLGAASPAARELQIHAQATEEQVQRMDQLPYIDLPANGVVRLEPAGLHLMLIDVAGPLAPGAMIELSLRFDTNAPVTLAVPVVDARAAAHEHH